MSRKTASEVRSEAAAIVAGWAEERERAGDPEGADVLYEVAAEIRAIALASPKDVKGGGR